MMNPDHCPECDEYLQRLDTLKAERDWLRAEIEKPADVLNAHDAVTDEDAALWETSPGDALARAISGLLDDLLGCQQDMHALAQRVNDLEVERNRLGERVRQLDHTRRKHR